MFIWPCFVMYMLWCISIDCETLLFRYFRYYCIVQFSFSFHSGVWSVFVYGFSLRQFECSFRLISPSVVFNFLVFHAIVISYDYGILYVKAICYGIYVISSDRFSIFVFLVRRSCVHTDVTPCPRWLDDIPLPSPLCVSNGISCLEIYPTWPSFSFVI